VIQSYTSAFISLLVTIVLTIAMLAEPYAYAEPTILYGAPISIEMARKAAQAAIAEGKKHDWPVAVAVVDTAGTLVYFERIDGTQTGSIELAIEKARTAVAYKRSTKMLEDRIVAGRLQYLRQTGAIPIEGGLPLLEAGRIVGAIGVSGVRSEQDGVCADAGLKAVEITTGTVSGKILGKNGESMSGGKILLFRADSGPPPARIKYWRTPDEIVDVNSDGGFKAKLAAGSYYMAALRRISSESIGPPSEGDWIYPDSRESLKKEQQIYVVKKGQNTDIGIIKDLIVLGKDSDISAAGITAIEGVVSDIHGNPVEDAIAFAYNTPDLTGKPLFTSARTGKDGKYLLRVSEGGKYYIKIRNTREGGHPVDGEIIGQYGNDRPSEVTVKSGVVKKGIDIVGRRFDSLMSGGPLSKGIGALN